MASVKLGQMNQEQLHEEIQKLMLSVNFISYNINCHNEEFFQRHSFLGEEKYVEDIKLVFTGK